MPVFYGNIYNSIFEYNISSIIQGNKSTGYYYIIIGILLLISSFNRMYRKRNK